MCIAQQIDVARRLEVGTPATARQYLEPGRLGTTPPRTTRRLFAIPRWLSPRLVPHHWTMFTQGYEPPRSGEGDGVGEELEEQVKYFDPDFF
jgi:hypothetical protein